MSQYICPNCKKPSYLKLNVEIFNATTSNPPVRLVIISYSCCNTVFHIKEF